MTIDRQKYWFLRSLPTNLFRATQLGISVLAIYGLFQVTQNTGNLWQSVSQVFNYQVTEPEINNPRILIKQMQEVSELTTSVFVMDTIIPTSSRRLLGNMVVGETKLLYIARGEVKAGLDLSKLTAEDIQINQEQITVKLPAPEILDSKIDVNKSQVYDYDRGFLNLGPDLAPQLQTQAQRYSLQKIKTTACQQDILDQANQKAEVVVTQLMSNIGYQDIKVITSKQSNCS